MTKWFKQICVLLVLLMLLSNVAVVFAQTTDYSKNWANQEISKWLSYGVIETDADGAFKPSDTMRRIDMAVLLNKIFNYQEKSSIEFSDITSDMSFAEDVALSVEAGNFIGDGGRFRPNDPLTRQEAAIIFARAFNIKTSENNNLSKFLDFEKIAPWSKDSVNAIVGCGYMNGLPGNIFAPTNNITRAEAVKMVDNIIEDLKNKAGTYTGDVNGNLVVNTKDITLKDMSIKGDLFLTEGIGDGEVKLDNVKIAGRTIVKGGGENSIILNNTSISGSLIIIKKDGKIRVVASGNCDINNVSLNSGVKLEESNLTGPGFGVVEVMRVAPGQQIILDGDFISLDILADDVKTVIPNGTVGTLNIRNGTRGSDIVIGGAASVTNLIANGEANVIGGSRITNAEINTNGVEIDIRPANLEIAQGVAATVAGISVTDNSPAPTTTHTIPNTPISPPSATPSVTITGHAFVYPGISTIKKQKTIDVYYIPEEKTNNQTVVFNLPDEFTATISDKCYIISQSVFNLTTENISNSGKTVTVKNLNLLTNACKLSLINRTMPTTAKAILFSVASDSDGDQNGSLISSTTTAALEVVSTVSDLWGYSTSDQKVRLNWTAPEEADLVSIQYSVSEAESWVQAGPITTSATNADVTGLAPNTEYDFKLTVTGGINAGESNIETVRTKKTPPVLTADTDNNIPGQDIVLTFTDNSEWRDSIYQLHIEGTNYSINAENPLFSVAAGTITIDKSVFIKPGNYGISVSAGSYSTAHIVQPIKGPIWDAYVYHKNDESVTLKFTAPEGATSVKIQQTTGGGITWTDATYTPPINAFSTQTTVTDLEPNTSYEFRLVVEGGNRAGISNVVSVTTESMLQDFTTSSITITSNSAIFTFTAPVGATLVKIEQTILPSLADWTDSQLIVGSSLDATSTTASVIGLIPDTAYVFRVYVIDGSYAGYSNMCIVVTDE